jgi:hypothetical protein
VRLRTLRLRRGLTQVAPELWRPRTGTAYEMRGLALIRTAMRDYGGMPIQLADGFAGRLLDFCDQAQVVLHDAEPRDLAIPAMQAARRKLYEVPHPDEDDAFVHFADQVTVGPDGPTFWFDAADAGYQDALDGLISALLAGLAGAGLVSGTLDCQQAGS